jgi:hypothetical protein
MIGFVQMLKVKELPMVPLIIVFLNTLHILCSAMSPPLPALAIFSSDTCM